MRTRATRILGWATALSLALTAVLALIVSPADVNQKDAVRLLYLHVPTAWLAMYVSFGVTSLASALYLWPRTRSRFWDLTAGASAEIGVVFLGLTLLIGSIWGRTTWGVWWTWDARLTTTAVLFVLYLGYLAVRRVVADPEVAAKRAAIVAIAAFLDVPIVHKSVEWWRTLHQPASLFDERRLLDPQITGVMLVTLLVAVLAFTLLYAWLLIHRFRLAWLEDRAADRRMELALAERHAEAGLPDGGALDAGAPAPAAPVPAPATATLEPTS
ncbi:MAG: heme exporter protein [Actinomycetota bacterium]|jgi:heme exporter protein C|nr:heme exporter protein [Actinomycetota bacterium]